MRNISTPYKWVVIEHKFHHARRQRVLAGFAGSYGGEDWWKLNSGIYEFEELTDRFVFSGHSGSTYVCYKENYGLTNLTSDVLERLLSMPELEVQVVSRYDPIVVQPESTS